MEWWNGHFNHFLMDGALGDSIFAGLCTLAQANAHDAMPWILWPTEDPWVFRQPSKEAPKVIEDQEQELSQEEFI